MSKSASVGKNVADPIEQPTTDRTSVATVVTDHLRFIDDWDAYRTVSECSEATIHRLAEA
jgi:hypothetical protein